MKKISLLQRLKKQDEFQTSLDTQEWGGVGRVGGWGQSGVREYRYNTV